MYCEMAYTNSEHTYLFYSSLTTKPAKGLSMLDIARWNRLIAMLCKWGPDGHWFAQLTAAYNQSHRYYHNTNHITHCLQQFDQAVHLTRNPCEVEFAIWLHDAVYDSQASDNEEKSAELACQILSAAGGHRTIIQRVETLILDTRHDRPPNTGDARFLVDIDLSSLGHSPEQYDQYEKAIREEYAWVPMDLYRQKRRQILTGFLNRPKIYHTDLFSNRYETQARANIQRVLNRYSP